MFVFLARVCNVELNIYLFKNRLKDIAKAAEKILEYESIWLDIGESKLYFDSNFKYKKYMNDLSSNSYSENVNISSDSLVNHSIIWENTTIGNNSIISNCIVTGNLSLNNVNYSHKIISDQKVHKF